MSMLDAQIKDGGKSMAKYIDADALMEQRPENLNTSYFDNDIAQYNKGWNACNKYWINKIMEMPAADVEPVRYGEWNGEGDGYADGEIVLDVWRCSKCGYCIDDGIDDPRFLPNYCPDCGAMMDGGRP